MQETKIRQKTTIQKVQKILKNRMQKKIWTGRKIRRWEMNCWLGAGDGWNADS